MWELIIAGVVLAAIVAGAALALRNARKRGIAEADAESEREAREAEDIIHDIQAERRDPQKTKRRLDEGTF